MKYRPEIDGLRAIAVLAVIFFHAGYKVFSGGYVGVDIFFVISGYLITSIILKEREKKGGFSLFYFYERRARRILPALFFVMIVSFLLSWFWLIPSDMKDFSKSLISVSFFVSNIFFWSESDYWDVENELKPLLHTWSLAVEEQFYMIYPMLLLLVTKLGKRSILIIIVMLAAISLFLSQRWLKYDQAASYFLLPTRVWELAIGAIVALLLLDDRYKDNYKFMYLTKGRISEILAVFGVFLIIYSIISFNNMTYFPGLNALFPTIGAALVILFASKENLIGKILSAKILVVIGLLSYSAYLWHQVLFAFARHKVVTKPSDFDFILLVLLTFLMAYLSWKFIERPFRDKNKLPTNVVLKYFILSTIGFVSVGYAGYYSDGFSEYPLRNKLPISVIEKRLEENTGLSKDCDRKFTLTPNCRTNDSPEILVWGDSFAMHIVDGLVASYNDVGLIQFTKSFCGPFFDLAPISRDFTIYWAKGCLNFTESVRQWVEKNKSIRYAVISSPFSQYLRSGNRLVDRDGNVHDADFELVKKEFLNTLRFFERQGIIPVIFSPPPASDFDIGRCLVKAEWFNYSLDMCNFRVDQLSENIRLAYNFLYSLPKKYSIIYLDKFICKNNTCLSHIEDIWIYRDDGHLSKDGSTILGRKYDFY